MKNKVLKATIAVVLIMAMVIADFVIVGMELVTYALENMDNLTNHQNVKFAVHFKTGDEEIIESEYEIVDGEMKLYLKVAVENEGYFDGVVTLENANFKLKEQILSEGVSKIEGNTVELKRVRAGNEVEIELGIEPVIEEAYSENMLSKESVLKLTGTYVDSLEKKASIESEKKVTLSLLAPSNLETALEGKVITNRIYKIGEENKRIVQLELNSEVLKNAYPIKATNFEISLPEGVEEVKVISKGTYATTGEADRIIDEKNYEYNAENKVLKVKLENTSKDEKISWKQEGKDNIIVTLILDEQTQIVEEEYSAKAKVEFYGSEEKVLEKENKYNLTQEADGIIRSSIENKEEIYKGKIYSKEDREYSSVTNIEVNYEGLVGNAVIEEKVIYREETKEKQSNVQYRTTTILKSEFEKVLGAEGKLTIKDPNGNIVKEVTTADFDEEGKIVIEYPENTKELTIEITKAIQTGIIRLNHTKVIKPEEYTVEEIRDLKYLVEQQKVIYSTAEYSYEKVKQLGETTSDVGLTVTPQIISAEEQQEVQIAITLKTDNERYELYKNPTFRLVLPDGVTINSLSNGVISATNEEFSISKLEINNSKEIVLEINGEQQKYITSDINTQINFSANVTVERLMANKVDTIKMQYTNKEKVYEAQSNAINIITSNSKIVTNLKVENFNGEGARLEKYSDTAEKIIGDLPIENTEIIKVPIKYTIVNNYDCTIAPIAIIEANLTDKDGIEKDLINYSNTEIEIESGKMQVIETTLEIPAGLYYSDKIDLKTQLEYNHFGTKHIVSNDINLETEEKEGIRDVSIIDNKVRLETFTQLGNGAGIKENDEIYNEQILEYIMEVTNISDEVISNIKITNEQENGNLYDLKEVWVTDRVEEFIEHEYDELDTNIKTFDIEKLNPGEEKELIFRIVPKKDNITNKTTANISIMADGIENRNISPISNNIKDADLKIISKNALREEVQMYGNDVLYMLTNIKNLTNEKKENIKVRKHMTEGLSYTEECMVEAMDTETEILNIIDNVTYNEAEQYVEFDITKLEPNEEVIILSILYIKPLPLEKMSSDEIIYVTANDSISNSINVNIQQNETKFSVVQTTNIEEGQKVKDGDTVIIIGEITNIGGIDTNIVIEDILPNGLEANKVEIIKENQTIQKTEGVGKYNVSVASEIKKGEKIIVKIETTVNTARIVTDSISNTIVIIPTKGERATSNKVIILVENEVDTEDDNTGDEEPDYDNPEDDNTGDEEPDYDNPEDDNNPDDNNPGYEGPEDNGGNGESDDENPEYEKPGDNPNDDNPNDDDPNDDDPNDDNPNDDDPNDDKPNDDKPDDKLPTYSVSGYAWVDKNLNGNKDEKERLENVIVKILDINNNNTFLKDKNGKEIEVKTDKNGAYKIENIPEGKYNVIFKYDTSLYELKENEEIKDYIIEKTKEKIAITNNINLDSDQTVDLQLIELKEFDLKIDKYITKVIVQTDNGTKTSGYEGKQLVREEIQSKYLSGATVLVEYTFKISNIGELAGYATEIMDYMPKDMKFHSQINTQWYMGEDGNIYNTSLASTSINPGESKTLKLVLIKSMTKNNTGITSNTVEISGAINNQNYVEKDVKNNQSKAEIIINPATGIIVTYTIAILASIAIVSLRNVYNK